MNKGNGKQSAPESSKSSSNNDATNIAELFFALLRIKLCESAAWEKQYLSEDELKQLYSLAKKHDVSPILMSSLTELKLFPEDKNGEIIKAKAIWRYEKLNHELKEICRVLEKNNIDYIPLKGAVIRQYYPEPWLRMSCDIDILVHEEDLDRLANVLMHELDYTLDKDKSIHHISMHSPSGVHLEPHFNLHESKDQLNHVLDEVWDNSSSTGGHCYLQSPEFLMFHIIAHMSYHFGHGGCGIKPFIDLYLLDKKLDYDREKLMDFCDRAGIAQFYRCVRQVIDVWFNEAAHTEVTQRIEEFVLSGGVYGTKTNAVVIEQERAGNKFKHILKRIFMPYRLLKIKYPILVKHPWLTPVYQVVRWIQMLLKRRLRTYTSELDMICGLSDERREEIRSLLEDVGL